MIAMIAMIVMPLCQLRGPFGQENPVTKRPQRSKEFREPESSACELYACSGVVSLKELESSCVGIRHLGGENHDIEVRKSSTSAGCARRRRDSPGGVRRHVKYDIDVVKYRMG